jgi:sarcosine oxidase
MTNYDVIVIGLGAMGASTLYELSRRGVRALGIEQFAQGHDRGSSHGDSRIIREMYFEHPLYVPLVQRAYDLWHELEAESGKSLMTIDGGLMIGPPDGMVVAGTLRSAREHSIAHEVLSPDEVHRRYPAFEPQADLSAVVDPRAGYLDPEACTRAHIDLARQRGADVRYEEPVVLWSAGEDGVVIETTSGRYQADRIVFAAGSWSKQVLSDLNLPLKVERQVVFWFDPEESSVSYRSADFPIFAYEFTPGILCYGFPRLPLGVKASIMHGGETSDSPDDIRRAVDDNDIAALRAALQPVVPALSRSRVIRTSTCLFTNTPDTDFIIDFHPLHPRVLISSPCSGHGFKFASVVGEVQADLLTNGTSRFDLTPFSLARFQ